MTVWFSSFWATIDDNRHLALIPVTYQCFGTLLAGNELYARR
jgi:hypothetical protein